MRLLSEGLKECVYRLPLKLAHSLLWRIGRTEECKAVSAMRMGLEVSRRFQRVLDHHLGSSRYRVFGGAATLSRGPDRSCRLINGFSGSKTSSASIMDSRKRYSKAREEDLRFEAEKSLKLQCRARAQPRTVIHLERHSGA